MLVLPNDSGYNSPCNGIFPSSFALSPSKLLPDVSSKICRKLDFGTRMRLDTDDITSTDCSCRSREIANTLIRMCDLFDNEFSRFSQRNSWTAFILRLLGY